jgi:hypothetical protein
MEAGVRQSHVAKIIRDLCGEARAEQVQPDIVADKVLIAGEYAWALYRDLETTTKKPIVSPEMESRRGTPSDPGYFDGLDSIEEFINCLGKLGTAGDKTV